MSITLTSKINARRIIGQPQWITRFDIEVIRSKVNVIFNDKSVTLHTNCLKSN